MAITFVRSQNFVNSVNPPTSGYSVSVNPSGGNLLLLYIPIGATSSTGPNSLVVTYNSITLTRATLQSTSTVYGSLYVVTNPGNSTATVNITWTGSIEAIGVITEVFSGYGSTDVINGLSNSTAVTSLVITGSAAGANELQVMFVAKSINFIDEVSVPSYLAGDDSNTDASLGFNPPSSASLKQYDMAAFRSGIITSTARSTTLRINGLSAATYVYSLITIDLISLTVIPWVYPISKLGSDIRELALSQFHTY
jgi:hypothetical protein